MPLEANVLVWYNEVGLEYIFIKIGRYNENIAVGGKYASYFGEATAFNCTIDMFVNQVKYKAAYVFNDYNGETIACGVLSDDGLTLPQNPERDGWIFIGWDINGDGVADTVEITSRTLLATAVYNRQFTYK